MSLASHSHYYAMATPQHSPENLDLLIENYKSLGDFQGLYIKRINFRELNI